MYITGLKMEKKLSVSKQAVPCRGIRDKSLPYHVEHQQTTQLHTKSNQPFSQLPGINQYRSQSGSKIVEGQKKDNIKHISQKMITNDKLVPKRVQQVMKDAMRRESEVGSRKAVKAVVPDKGVRECSLKEQSEVLAYYRYYPVLFIASCGLREDLMKNLAEKGEIAVYNFREKQGKRDMEELWQKLVKVAQLKGKYKYRQRFNPGTSAQLKAINYKRKEQKKKRESSSSSSEEESDKKEKCRDLETWKKSMGVEGSKVFIIKGKYKDLRNALLERSWVENEDKHSLFYDLKWTTKVNDINFETLKSAQLVNHFNNNACLTSKYGLCKSLRSIMCTERIDIDRFFPKAYDLCDLSDFQNYLEMHKWVFCESILKRFLAGKDTISEDIVKVAAIVTERRLLGAQKLLSAITNSHYHLCSINQWLLLTGEKCSLVEIHETFSKWGYPDNHDDIARKVAQLLAKLRAEEPQLDLNGQDNIWIVKPAFLSRGRGIKCVSELNDILDYGVGKQTQYVVQKYIQNPLIINKRKFDIRQWVIVEDYNPPKIWHYSEFYVRFCLEDYDPSKLANKFAHLTNNSVQKHNTKVNSSELMHESMWTQEQLRLHIEGLYGSGTFKTIVGKMKEIVVATIISTQDQVYGRKNSFELIGYDFMIDDKLNPWLIEINSSPSMDYSTPVTRRLVQMVLEDTVKVVVDLKKKKSKKKSAGLFKCIHSGDSAYEFKYYSMDTVKKSVHSAANSREKVVGYKHLLQQRDGFQDNDKDSVH